MKDENNGAIIYSVFIRLSEDGCGESGRQEELKRWKM